METAPRPGYYPDPSVPGYIRYWDGSKWVPGTSKPMPEGVGGGADEAETEAKAEARTDAVADSVRDAEPAVPEAPKPAAPSLADVNFDDLLPPEFDAEPEPQAPASPPAFPVPPSMSELSFDVPQAMPPAAPPPAEPEAPAVAPGFPPPPIVGPSGMGISFSGPGVPHGSSGPTPAQLAATSQALRIRLLRPDGKPFDGPEITTGSKQPEAPADQARNGYDGAQRGPKKQAPKVVVKAGPLERLGHTAAVLAISAIGIVPLAYLLLQSVHDREDKLAAKITVPTKMNVLDGTAEAYLAAMAAVLLVVALVYWTRLKRRRMR